jgi:hypothetical protein
MSFSFKGLTFQIQICKAFKVCCFFSVRVLFQVSAEMKITDIYTSMSLYMPLKYWYLLF